MAGRLACADGLLLPSGVRLGIRAAVLGGDRRGSVGGMVADNGVSMSNGIKLTISLLAGTILLGALALAFAVGPVVAAAGIAVMALAVNGREVEMISIKGSE